MRFPPLALVSALFLACESPPPAPPLVAGAPAPALRPPAPPAGASASTPPVATPTAPEPPPALEAERRAVLEQLVSFDTSHGREIDALKPIAERLDRAGVHAELFEAGPGRGDLVARLRGSGAKRPLLLLAHIDVVPIEGQPWTVTPFHVTEKEGFLYGRGVNDDKGMASSIVAIALELARTRAALSRDVIVALTAGEETDGIGIRWLLENHHDLLDAEIALNEGGGAFASDDLSRIDGIGVGAAEKIFQSYRLVVRGPGGHSSLPPPGVDPVATLARGLERVAALKLPARALPAIKDELGFFAQREKPPLSDALRHAAASAPKIAPADEKVLSTDRYYNALVHTTCVTTMLQAAPQDNVLPTTAEAVINCRLLPDETPDQVKAVLEGAIADHAVEVRAEKNWGFGPASTLDGAVLDAMRKAAAAHWPKSPVFPTMGTGASDSRFLRAAGIRAYGLSTQPTSLVESRAGRTAHGPDERVPVRWFDDGVRFLRDVVLELAK
jgi:acetylornithine deacetylase/succinyl-diaminopimelate desuccinylase-like protein